MSASLVEGYPKDAGPPPPPMASLGTLGSHSGYFAHPGGHPAPHGMTHYHQGRPSNMADFQDVSGRFVDNDRQLYLEGMLVPFSKARKKFVDVLRQYTQNIC